MRIFLDNIIFNLQYAGGISIVWQNLIKNLFKITDDVYCIENNHISNLFRKELVIKNAHIKKNKFFNPILSQFLHPKIRHNDPFIFHSSYFRTCKNKNAINVTTVHDFIYEQEKNISFKQKLRIKLNYNAIRRSDAVVCISENTKKDLLKFVPNVNPQQVYVIHNGVSEDYKIIDKNSINQRFKDYVLFVGGRQSYKNFKFVIDNLKNTEYNLLICGCPLSVEEVKILDKALPNRYESITFPSNRELNIIYNSVYALIYPSSYEGFGIPVLEAQRAGCPVIALNKSSIPEIIGDTPLLMRDLSETSLLDALNILKDNNKRNKIIDQGVINSQRFSWKRMANEYFILYTKLFKEKTCI